MKAVNYCMFFSFKINIWPVSSYISKASPQQYLPEQTLKPINSKNDHEATKK